MNFYVSEIIFEFEGEISKMKCSAYLVFRFLIGILDISSDILLCVHLILEDHLFWAIAVEGWVVLAIVMSIFAVIVERCRRGVPMSPCKYILMSMKIHAEIGEAFFESGPQLVTQLMLLWSGILQHDFEVTKKDLLYLYILTNLLFADIYWVSLP